MGKGKGEKRAAESVAPAVANGVVGWCLIIHQLLIPRNKQQDRTQKHSLRWHGGSTCRRPSKSRCCAVGTKHSPRGLPPPPPWRRKSLGSRVSRTRLPTSQCSKRPPWSNRAGCLSEVRLRCEQPNLALRAWICLCACVRPPACGCMWTWVMTVVSGGSTPTLGHLPDTLNRVSHSYERTHPVHMCRSRPGEYIRNWRKRWFQLKSDGSFRGWVSSPVSWLLRATRSLF